jgi:hypothetical protein
MARARSSRACWGSDRRAPPCARRSIQPRRRRIRSSHVSLRPVGVGQDVLARRGARAALARDESSHRRPRPQLGLRASGGDAGRRRGDCRSPTCLQRRRGRAPGIRRRLGEAVIALRRSRPARPGCGVEPRSDRRSREYAELVALLESGRRAAGVVAEPRRRAGQAKRSAATAELSGSTAGRCGRAAIRDPSWPTLRTIVEAASSSISAHCKHFRRRRSSRKRSWRRCGGTARIVCPP